MCMPGAQNQDLEAAESSESDLEAAESKNILSFGVSPKNKIPKKLALFREHSLFLFWKNLTLFRGHLLL